MIHSIFYIFLTELSIEQVSVMWAVIETCLLDVSEYEKQDLYRMQARLAPAEPEYRDSDRAGAGMSSHSCTSPDAVTLRAGEEHQPQM